jgi:hypothetical protein
MHIIDLTEQKPHNITQMNDNINMDNTIVGTFDL